jgi:hypothetical protein
MLSIILQMMTFCGFRNVRMKWLYWLAHAGKKVVWQLLAAATGK